MCILYRVVAFVSDIFLDRFIAVAVGIKGWVHKFPCISVKGDCFCYPAFVLDVDIDPGMLDVAGIANLKFAGNILTSKHCRSQCCIIKADAGA